MLDRGFGRAPVMAEGAAVLQTGIDAIGRIRELASEHVVIVADCDHKTIEIERGVLKDVCGNIPLLECKTEDQVIEQCAGAEGLIIMYAPITRRVMGHLKRCKIIARYGVGVDTIDLKAAAEAGIIVSNVPDYGMNEVADHALAMMLALTRKVLQANATVKAGKWDFRLMQPIHRHQEQTVGVIGVGRIGGGMARRVHGIGMKVIACDPYIARDKVPDYVKLVSLEELMRTSDVVSVHCPLTDETRMMLDAKTLGLMKPTAYLINTARGSIIDETVLESMLAQKKIAGAAMDCLMKEPPVDNPLFRHDNFIVSPHMAWHSNSSVTDLKRKAAEEVRRVLRGEAPLYQVNKF
jgi:D-3-phosphoglycerate dehydrogenase / 2-oxoglutarate reductase